MHGVKKECDSGGGRFRYRRRNLHLHLYLLSVLAPFCGVEATYSLDDATLSIAELDRALSHPVYASTILQDGFRSQFFYNGSKVLYDNVGSLLFGSIRTLQNFGSYYHLWTGFEDGAFLGYYDRGTVAGSDSSFYTISWQTSYNHSCDYNTTLASWKSKLEVPKSGLSYPGWPSQRASSMRLSSYCREYFHAKKDNGRRVNSFSGQAYDCRMRGWYFLVKRNPVMQWTGVYIDRTTNEVAIPLCTPLFNATGYTTSNPETQYSSKVLPDSKSLLGVACTGFYLSDISKVLASIFKDFETKAVYVRERSSGYLIAASTASVAGYYDATTHTRQYPTDSPDPLLKWSAQQLIQYGNGSWPSANLVIVRDANETILPERRYRNLSTLVAARSYYISSQLFTSNGLEWDLVSIQRLSCPVNSERGCKHNRACGSGELTCVECVHPLTSLGGNGNCDQCVAVDAGTDSTFLGYYYLNGQCKDCPLGSSCEKAGTTLSSLSIKSNYFRFTKESTAVYRCPVNGQCIGDSICSDTSQGPLCSVCVQDFYADPNRYKMCRSCSIQASLIWTTTGVLLVGIFIILFLKYETWVPKDWLKSVSYTLTAPHALFKTLQTAEVGARVKILFTAYQIIGATKETLPSLRFPKWFEYLLALLNNVAQLDVSPVPIACIISGLGYDYNHYKKLLWNTILPPCVWSLISLALIAYGGKRTEANLKYSFLLVSFLFLPSVSEACFSMLDCTEFNEGDEENVEMKKYLTADLSIPCEDDNRELSMWRAYAYFFWFSPFGGPLGTPILVFGLLRWFRDHIEHPPGESFPAKLRARKQDGHLDGLEWIWSAYKPQFWYWEALEILRRVMMTGALVLWHEDRENNSTGEHLYSKRLMCAILLAFVSVVGQQVAQPYQDGGSNMCALIAHVVVFFLFYFGSQIMAKVIDRGFSTSLALGIGIFVPILYFISLQLTEEEQQRRLYLLEMEQMSQKEEMQVQMKHLLLAEEQLIKQLAEVDAFASLAQQDANRPRNISIASLSPMRKAQTPVPIKAEHRSILKLHQKIARFDEKGFYPCYVMSLKNIMRMEKLLTHEEALHSDPPLLDVVTRDSLAPSPAHTYFISQNWESEDHPDNNLGTKLAFLKNLLAHCSIEHGREIWIWFDIFSIPQADRKLQLRAIDSIQFYSSLISRFIPLVRDPDCWRLTHGCEPSRMAGPSTPVRGSLETYQSRGWCRLEVFCALCPKRFRDGSWRPGPVGLRYYYHHSPHKLDGSSSLGPPLEASSLLDPLADDVEYTCCFKARQQGKLEDHCCDRPKIAKIVDAIACQYIAYSLSGSSSWDMTLDIRSELPDWIHKRAAVAAEVGARSIDKSKGVWCLPCISMPSAPVAGAAPAPDLNARFDVEAATEAQEEEEKPSGASALETREEGGKPRSTGALALLPLGPVNEERGQGQHGAEQVA